LKGKKELKKVRGGVRREVTDNTFRIRPKCGREKLKGGDRRKMVLWKKRSERKTLTPHRGFMGEKSPLKKNKTQFE